jgi:hypothetical protein
MSEAGAGQRRYRNPLADYRDQALFFGTFILGVASILSLKWFGYSEFVATAAPVFLMFAYAGIALATKQYRLREDKAGDNIYYLGFLFTLTALAYALYSYNPEGSGATEIITNFGIAIFTTIMGLALRVLFNQMREDPVEYEKEARYSLAEASRTLRAELADVSTEMSSFKRKIIQITEEGVTDIAESAKASMRESVVEFSGVAKSVAEKIEGAFSSFNEHSNHLNEIASKNVEALEVLFARIEKIDVSPELITAKLEPVISMLSEVAEEANRRNRSQTNDLKRVRSMVDAATEAGDLLMKRIETSDAAFGGKIERFTKGLESSLSIVNKFAETLDASGKNLTAEIQAIKNVSVALQEGIDGQKSVLSNLRQGVDAELSTMKKARDEAGRMLGESEDALNSLQTALVSLSNSLVEQLSGGHTVSAR